MSQVFVRASRRAKAYTRSSGATFRSSLKAGPYSKRALSSHNSISHHLKYGKKRSSKRRLQLRNIQDKLKEAYSRH